MPRSDRSSLWKRLQAGFGYSNPPSRRSRQSHPSAIPALVERLETRVLLSAATVDLPTASSVTSTTASLDGNISSDGGSSVTERGFLYSLTSVNSSPVIGDLTAVQVADVGAGTGAFSIPVTGLDPLSQYTVVAYAINGDGTSYSTAATFTTLEAPSLVVTTTSDVVDATDGLTSLREALNYANGTAGADTITFGGPVFTDANPDTITLSLGQLAITDSVTISGTGASSLTIDGDGSSRVFYLYNNSALLDITLSGMTITGGNASFGGGIVDFDENLTLVDSVVTGNTVGGKGGGVFADGFNMTLTIRRTVISNNISGSDGGGIYVEDTGGLLTIEDSTISGNQASGDGGGIYFYDPDHDVVITRSTISGNTAAGKGGGIYLYSMDNGSFTIENSTITGNQANVGGGVYLYGADTPMIIRNSTIANNTATTSGGGLMVHAGYSPTFDISNTIFSGNTANSTPDDLLILNGGFTSVTNSLIQNTGLTTLNGATVADNILGQDPLLGPLANNGGYTQTMALASNSPARNAGTTVGAPTVDQRGVLRDATPDIGAYEISPPALAGIEATPAPYPPNGPATVITSSLTVNDLDSASLTGATIQISAGYQTGDVLSFANTANITGVFNSGTGTLTLTGTDTVANYQAALRSVTYSSTSQSPATRTISFQATDGAYLSNTITRDVGGYAQLTGTTLNVFGTPQVDVITVNEGATLNIVVAGILTQFTPAQVTSINIFGFSGDDSIQINSLATGTALTAYGMGGNDTIRVNAAVTQGVTLNGAAGNDLLIGGSGNDTLVGGIGDDWLNGGDGNDTLTGNTGNDVYAFSDTSTNQVDTIVELAGDAADALNFAAMTTAVTVNLTSDTALATMSRRIVKVGSAGQSANIENVFGGAGNDTITGNAAANVIYGNGGNDTISGGDGNDQIDGGQGNDLLKGGNNDDVLIGGLGDDYLKGDAGNDLLDGDDGFNTLAGGTGDDRYLFFAATVNQVDTVLELGSEGNDTLDFSSLTTAVNVNLSSDTALATMDHRIVQAGAGQSANFENALGGSGNDQITGNAANNVLSGNGGDDTITGNGGNDVLIGGIGNDTLKGISGRNILIGGTGADLLLGGTGDDLLLSGSTIYDTDTAVLQILMSEWSSAATYPLRIDHLTGVTAGGANTTFVFSSSTTTNDNSADYLTGNGGQDWFLANSLQDTITDKAVDEVFTHIDTWI